MALELNSTRGLVSDALGMIPIPGNECSPLVSIPLESLPEGRESGLLLSRGKSSHLRRTRNDWELIVVRRGRLPLSEDGRDVSVQAGEYLLLRPGLEHRGTEVYPLDLEFDWLHFSARGGQPLQVPARAPLPDARHTRELLLRYATVRHPLAASGIILELLASLISVTASHSHPLAQQADAIIARHFHEALSTSDVAQKLAVHPDHLGRVYRTARGCTVLQAIQRRRIRDAQELLLAGGVSQERIARDCGFADARYFRRIFRATMGVSPVVWLTEHRGGVINSR